MQYLKTSGGAVHHWQARLSPEGACYIVRDKCLVLEVFHIGKIEGIYKEQNKADPSNIKTIERPFVVYRKIGGFSVNDSTQRKDMPRANLDGLLKDALLHPALAEFDGGESFYAGMSFYVLAQKIDSPRNIPKERKKILSDDESKKCMEIFMKQFSSVHMLNGKTDGLEGELALGREISIALELESEGSVKYWELLASLHFT